MDAAELSKTWKKILIDNALSETQFFEQRGISQQAGNRKIREGTIKYIDFVNLLNDLGYDVTIHKRGEIPFYIEIPERQPQK